MIIVQIKGGLGNQLFSYAAAYGIAKENNTELVIDRYIYDTSYFLRKYMLNNFPSIVDEHVVNYVPSQSNVSQYLYKLIRKIRIKYKYKAQVILEEEEFKYQHIDNKGKNLYLNGYWQNYLYFDKYRDDIVEKFTPVVNFNEHGKSLLNEIEKGNSVAVHIRRGDYVNFKGGKCLDMSYYMKAINYLTNTRKSNLTFFIFTDDVKYCKDVFANLGNVKFVAEEAKLNDLEEFSLMTKCKDLIIGNSSFSWWAAYLASHKDKVVIAPVVDMWKEEFYLPEWTKINAKLQ
ncbi:alpha-1,2-fucosyltransferase [uncultured Metabacillus sp.]|uniref:alpha-1,2-fucosyltransferase n=1 Tax=uncultured Metabacillus sp. TaxID=2860135 RepID=UPI00262AE050|nr:alpha-1,2-fucosyltransferase [uncultured Metabacillus sp.]